MLALASVKGSPGATTTALALAAVWPPGPRVVLAECDPAGGDLSANFGLAKTPGLLSLAAASRRERDEDLLWRHTQALPGGLQVVAGPIGADQARAALTMLAADSFAAIRRASIQPDMLVIADCGRLDPASPVLALARAADALVLVARPQLTEMAHLAACVTTLRRAWGSSPPARVGLVLAPGGSYPPAEVGQALDVPVLGVLPDDKHTAATLAGRVTIRRGLSRLPLMRAARTLADHLLPATAQPDRGEPETDAATSIAAAPGDPAGRADALPAAQPSGAPGRPLPGGPR
jgi:MinD-like ATPase involved in chromosome partitioning or flagellar assembly